MVIVHSPRCLDYGAVGHPESAQRVRAAVAQLHKSFHTWLTPEPCTDQDILRVHTPALLQAVKMGTFSDADTPFYQNIYEFAQLSAGAAIRAAQESLAGRSAFSLMRPPGHHAERDRVMGFCYFNNIAIAVARLLHTRPDLQRIAILDFDCHHGNGTEDIFVGNERVLFISLHQSPCYPGTGVENRGNCLNYPLPPGTEPPEFLAAIDEALVRVRNFQAQALAVSAGFDAYKGDPITHMGLEIDTFQDIGARIRRLELPAFAVLEGGYSQEFARCVEAFVSGWDGL